MGQIADAMISGLLCEVCGVYLDGDEPGYPRKCNDCYEESLEEIDEDEEIEKLHERVFLKETETINRQQT